MRKRIFAAAALTLALAILAVLGPLGPTNVDARRRPTITYRCVFDFSFGDLGSIVHVLNTGGSAASFRFTLYNASGNVTETNTLSTPPKALSVLNLGTTPASIEITTKQRLLVDGVSRYSNGAEPTIHRQIRCT